MSAQVTLSDQQLAQLADLIAERLRTTTDPPPSPAGDRCAKRLVTAAELAAELGVARGFVYEHRDELGAIRLGTGPKAPLRFDVESAKRAMSCTTGEGSPRRIASVDGASGQRQAPRRRRLPSGLPKPGSVLAVRGDAAAAMPTEEAA